MNLTRVIPPEGVVERYELIKPHPRRVRFFVFSPSVSSYQGGNMTQLEHARKGIMTPEMQEAALSERINASDLLRMIAKGEVVIPANVHRKKRNLMALGAMMRTKVNANVGTSPRNDSIDHEIEKARSAYNAGADAIMDLSIAGNIRETRLAIMNATPLTFGSVPLYEVMAMAGGDPKRITGDMMLSMIKTQAADGVDFMTVHTGITQPALASADERLMGIVSRGGSFMARWMRQHDRENPLYERFDELCDIARAHDVTLSLGDALRPGALFDAGDDAQYSEIKILGECVLRAREKGVQVIVEGPGHVPLYLIKEQVDAMKRECHNAPIYLLGPLVTDRAAGHDHIAAAIGGAIAAGEGASFLCYVTPAEHLRLPDLSDVHEGVIAAKIAGHAGDIAKNVPGAREDNRQFSQYRRAFNWEMMFTHAIDPQRARQYRANSTHEKSAECSMCGDFCSMRSAEDIYENK
jgi:phosphomethylpyrimidine synthase